MSYKSDPKETSIVPVENTALTVKSSALVRRGLEALISQELLMFRSPAERAPEPSRRADEYKDGVAAYQCGDYRTAFVKFMEAANRGYIEAHYMVGRMYDDGKGVLQDYNQAVFWYRKAAEQGSALAQIFLGESYSAGNGVPQDYNQAALWFGKAADQGDATAQRKLAWMYYRGQGVPKDYVEAHKWFNLAATNTNEKESRDKAIKNRDLLAQLMTPTEIAESEKRTREWKKTRRSLI
jgi:uncharacterized protein